MLDELATLSSVSKGINIAVAPWLYRRFSHKLLWQTSQLISRHRKYGVDLTCSIRELIISGHDGWISAVGGIESIVNALPGMRRFKYVHTIVLI